MTTLFFSHPSSLLHETGAGHPESADRLAAVFALLESTQFDGLIRRQSPRGSGWDLKRVHTDAYIQSVLAAVPDQGLVKLDEDTYLSPGSGDAAMYAVGGVCAAVDAVVGGDANNAFCAVRPPGHHAERDRAMGFCLFNNAAIAAFHALELPGIDRVAVMDFDVHHGNGTQQAFWDHENLMYASTHQLPGFPGSGMERERGKFGNIVNGVLPPGAGSDDFRDAIGFIRPALRDFAPDLLILSAGFDAHAHDPLAQVNLHEEDFAWVTREMMKIADTFAQGRVVSVLEGGYDIPALTRSVEAHVKALMAG